jgi:hypothetical protein
MDFDFLVESIKPTQLTYLTIDASGALVLPSGNTAARPGGVPAGSMRWNTDTPGMETYNGSAWVASAGSGTVTSVAITGSTGLTVGSSPITTAGTITLTLGTELQGLSGLSANGAVTRTAAGTYTSRTLTGTANRIAITNGDGVAGNPTVDLATITDSGTGTFKKVTVDTYGRVSGTQAVAAADITTALGYTPINKAGDTAIGSLTLSSAANINLSGGGTVTGLPTTPTNSTDAASKAYVDSLVQGLDPKASVRAATTASGTLASSFANGSVIDGVTLVTGDRILLKNQAAPAENGIYTVNASGAPTRANDMSIWGEVPGAFVFVEEGTTLADTGWVCTSNVGGTLNTTAITFVQFSGAGTYTAGTGLTLTGTTFSITSPVATGIGGTGLSSIGTSNQVLGVNNGGTALEYKTVTAGTAISVAHGANAITINNTGVTSAVAGTGIGVSGATGAVTITNNGVTAIAGTANQITASASTGSVTLSVPSAFVAPGSVQVTTGLFQSTATAVSAAGTTQGTATALTASNNVVTTVGANSGVILPSSTTAGWMITVINRGANPLNVYPNTSAAIDGAAANTPIVVPVNQFLQVINSSNTQWFTVDPVYAAGSGISVASGNGILTIANTGVTSIVAGTGISISGSTGAVTVNNTGVTSVALSLPSFLTVSGSPVTTTGTLTATLASQAANTVFIAPNGSAGAPTFRTLAYADLPIKLYVENPSTPTAPTAAGTNAVAIGSGSSASAANAVAIGDGTNSRIVGGKVQANGKFATAGDAQSGLYVLRNITSNATATDLFIDGTAATQRLTLVDNQTMFFKIDVVGRRTDATGGNAGYTLTGVIKRDSGVGSTALVGSVSKTIVSETNVAWDVNVTADASNGAIKVTVVGEAAKTVRWVATVFTTEVTN